MPFRRAHAPEDFLRGDDLTRAMSGIGMRFATKATPHANIEDTLIAASTEGMERDDLRVLSILVTWIEAHHPWINADRLTRALGVGSSGRVLAFWAAIAAWLHQDRRFSRIALLHKEGRVDLLRAGTEFHLARHGEDRRFEGTCLRVPADILRDRKGDVLTPAALAKRHRTYRQRAQMGPSYRADMWAELEADPTLTPAKLARRTYGSFATAWQVRKDFALLAA
ncbi:MAG: hypothetical protein HY608_10295 [Planctomycetes bacterium]|nr:hypothetical protein [Planctomycetota bacterium]